MLEPACQLGRVGHASDRGGEVLRHCLEAQPEDLEQIVTACLDRPLLTPFVDHFRALVVSAHRPLLHSTLPARTATDQAGEHHGYGHLIAL
jgi:hypothetical protein